MPGRKKLRSEIYQSHFMEIERRVHVLESAMSNASIGLSTYTPHGEAIMQLRKDLRKAINVLGNRPPDYHRHNGHMSPGEGAWHMEIERKGLESLPREGDAADDVEPDDDELCGTSPTAPS